MPFRYDFPTSQPPLRSASGRRVLRIGHSGAGNHAPPNSLCSLQLALDMGADMVEFDVRGCADGLILSHDETVETGDGLALLSHLSIQEVRSLTVKGEPIATLDEALDLAKGRSLVNLDMKDAGREREVADAILRHGMTDEVLVSSLYAGSLRRLREILPDVTTGMSYPEDKGGASGKPYMAPIVSVTLWGMRRLLPVIMGRLLGQSGADNVMLYHKVITPGSVRAFHSAGVRVFAWTVDGPERMRQLLAMDVDGIATNRPEMFFWGGGMSDPQSSHHPALQDPVKVGRPSLRAKRSNPCFAASRLLTSEIASSLRSSQ